MTALPERLNFSAKASHNSIEIKKWGDVNHYDTLCSYCAHYSINLDKISATDFEVCADLMADHGQSDKTTDTYHFWITPASQLA